MQMVKAVVAASIASAAPARPFVLAITGLASRAPRAGARLVLYTSSTFNAARLT